MFPPAPHYRRLKQKSLSRGPIDLKVKTPLYSYSYKICMWTLTDSTLDFLVRPDR